MPDVYSTEKPLLFPKEGDTILYSCKSGKSRPAVVKEVWSNYIEIYSGYSNERNIPGVWVRANTKEYFKTRFDHETYITGEVLNLPYKLVEKIIGKCTFMTELKDAEKKFNTQTKKYLSSTTLFNHIHRCTASLRSAPKLSLRFYL